MADWLKDIETGNESRHPDQERILRYLNHDMSVTEKEVFEREMKEDPFLQEACEGLSNLSNKQEIPETLQSIRHHLQEEIKERKTHKKPLQSGQFTWIYLSIILVILLILIAYLVIHNMYGTA